MTLRAIVLALCVVASPTAANAATVSVHRPPCADEQGKYGQCNPDEARFVAASGERNDLTFTAEQGTPGSSVVTITFHDTGAPLHPDPGCEQVDEHTVKCTSFALVAIVDTGDGDDTVDGVGQINGGSGNDTLTGSYLDGGPGDDKLQGTDQTDFLYAGPGRDVVSGGAGDDTIMGGGGGAGGAGVGGGGGNAGGPHARPQGGVAPSLWQ